MQIINFHFICNVSVFLFSSILKAILNIKYFSSSVRAFVITIIIRCNGHRGFYVFLIIKIWTKNHPWKNSVKPSIINHEFFFIVTTGDSPDKINFTEKMTARYSWGFLELASFEVFILTVNADTCRWSRNPYAIFFVKIIFSESGQNHIFWTSNSLTLTLQRQFSIIIRIW